GPNDRGGAVVFIPINTEAKRADGTVDTLANTMRTKFLAGLSQAAANLVGLSFDDAILFGPGPVTQYVTPVAPLSIQNPDRIVQVDSRGRTATRFAAGPLTLAANDVAGYLAARNPHESDLAHLARKQVLWTAWLDAIRHSPDPDAVPGETASGFGRFLRGLANGDVEVTSLPVHPQGEPGPDETFVADSTAVADLMARIVPLPTPANPGDRPRIRLLSGTGPIASSNVVVSKVVGAGGEIIIVGNADRFDYATTEIVYHDDQFAADAQKIQAALGLGTVSKSSTPTDVDDVTIILGKDAAAKYGGTSG